MVNCKVKGCPVTVRKVNSSKHWIEDQMCAYHAVKNYPEKYTNLAKIVKPIVHEIAQVLLI